MTYLGSFHVLRYVGLIRGRKNAILDLYLFFFSFNQTRGLLGTLDQNPDNDFRTPQDYVVASNANEQDIYTQFALTWNVSNEDSKFQWPKRLVSNRQPLMGNPTNFPYR